LAAESGRDRGRSDRAPASASEPGTFLPPAANSLEAFRVLVEKNIFNPNRVGRTRDAVAEKPLRIDEISLVGTMEYHGGIVAFFESPDSAYRKSVRTGEKIGDFSVRQIGADTVELSRDDQPLTLKVAQQLRRVEGGDWKVITLVATPPRSGPGGAAGSADDTRATAAAAAAEIPADASEALRKLLKKREKQLQK